MRGTCVAFLVSAFLALAIRAAPQRQSRHVDVAARPDMCSGAPSRVDFDVPEGNYDVAIAFGGGAREAVTTVHAEARRLLADDVRTAAGAFVTRTWTINVRRPGLRDGGRVRLKPDEQGHADWDDRLTIDIGGPNPCVRSIDVTPNDQAVTVYLAGDSTVTDQAKEPYAAWGQMLPRFLARGVAVANHAESGESLASFIGERRLAKILETIKTGDYLFIQFAHNDQKDGPSHLDPFTTYKEALVRYIDDARRRGATPVLVTSTHRRRFDEQGRIVNTLGDYPEAMRQTAREQRVALIDLNAMSRAFFEALGPDGTRRAFVHYPAGTFPGQDAELKDDTHVNAFGAGELARRVASGIRDSRLDLARFLANEEKTIDRQALVARHHPMLRTFDVESPLSLGNGEFAFTADVTGLQTFASSYDRTIPLATLSQWGWHTSPNPDGWSIDRYRFTPFESHGRMVGYADIPGDTRTPEVEWLRGNPHRLHLGQLAFALQSKDGRRAEPRDLTDIHQTLDLWNGILVSHFRFDGEPVDVETICHPALDAIAVRVVSPLVAARRLAIDLRFPYGTGASTAADWTRPAAHRTTLTRSEPQAAMFARTLDRDAYGVAARWAPAATLEPLSAHEFRVAAADGARELELVVAFSRQPPRASPPSFSTTRDAAKAHWAAFWQSGGAIDLSQSTDPRWYELERRIVLSQYLTAIQSAGSLPPQETGLTFNSWEGKFHLEMHWWHAVHFALWNRIELLERSLAFYRTILPRARATAARQGYAGARWPKMTGPTGAESPSTVGPFLIWQQPHPIYYAELAYRAHPDRATLERFRDIVFDTARFMASFAAWDETSRRAVLGPPLHSAQEVFPKERTFNPTFELTYWRWGLAAAQQWRRRLGLAPDADWQRALDRLARPTMADGKYLFAESAPDSYTNPRWARDHPAVLGSLGMLPGPGIDRETMRRTLHWVWEHWTWADTWGWDDPMVAMTAARLGEPELAIDALLKDTPKNGYRTNGHNHQRPGLTIYLPGNGALLTAVAMMAAGWDGAPPTHAPGFPADGRWVVRWENLRPLP